MNTTKQHKKDEPWIDEFVCYPLTFQPILKERIWGGNKLRSLGKDLPEDAFAIGESWEISMIDRDVNKVDSGVYKQTSLDVLLNRFPKQILGTKIYNKYGNQFPLLFKFLDAKSDLSIQLHPNDELAQKRHNSFGKTEMWYIMQADENARIILGFKKDSSPKEYVEHLKTKTLPDVLQEFYVKKGDVFFIETGTIHAIGGGILLAEIQQNSDITYRVYDWDRVDEKGKGRDLHIDLALDAINYRKSNPKINYDQENNASNELVNCPFFTTNYIPLTSIYEVKKTNECFSVYICTEGTAILYYDNGFFEFKKGTTVLIPAAMTDFYIKGTAKLIEVFINN